MSNNQNKRVNIINVQPIKDSIEGGEIMHEAGERVMRTTRSFAEKLVSTGMWRYCSKSKLKSFINKDMKLYKNMQYAGRVAALTGDEVNDFTKRVIGGKQYMIVPTFKFIHEKGEQIFNEVKSNGVRVIKHRFTNIIQTVKEEPQIISEYVGERSPLFGKISDVTPNMFRNKKEFNHKITDTGEKMIVISYTGRKKV